LYCKKCQYISHDHMDRCPKCGLDWTRERKKLGIEWLKPPQESWLASLLGQGPEIRVCGILSDDQAFYSQQLAGQGHGSSAAAQGQYKKAEHKAPLMYQKGLNSIKEAVIEKKSPDSGQDYEIEYPDLEIIDADENKP
jgi:hypothetical protein